MDLNIVEMLTDGTFVDQYYQMDPTTDDLIRSYAVRDGMRVLIESPTIKSELVPDKVQEDIVELTKALTYNRWATVTELAWNRKEGMISFIALYDDGTKAGISFHMSHNWYVKLDTVPEAGPNLFDFFKLIGAVVVQPGTPEEMADQVINAMKEAGVPLQDDRKVEWDIDRNQPMSKTREDEAAEIAKAGVKSVDPTYNPMHHEH